MVFVGVIIGTEITNNHISRIETVQPDITGIKI